jgi:sulfur-oxidizing protein SoxA
MKKAIKGIVSVLLVLLMQPAAIAGPEEDRLAFIAFYQARFPDIPVAEYANGIYAIDSDAREQWLEIEIFPPYEFAVEQGQELWEEVFADGNTYTDCFAEPVAEIRPLYPRFDTNRNTVVTLETAINYCRSMHNEPELDYAKPEITAITAYLAFAARGNKLDIRVGDDPRALAAYEAGKQFYYTKRGQLNFSCVDCHGISSGLYARADRLSASLGHPTHFPVYRSKFGRMLSIHERFSGCVFDIRAKTFALQSEEFRNLEYFLTYMSNGFEVNGPGARK